MYGDIRSRLTPAGLAARLSKAGIDVQVKRWSYDDGGQYIHVFEADDFILLRVSTHGYQADAICGSARQLQSAASQMSSVLADLQIKHRFSLFEGQSLDVEYLHHRWPKASPTPAVKLYRPEGRTWVIQGKR
jgi:hypothetical protein